MMTTEWWLLMVTAMTASKLLNNSICLFGALLLLLVSRYRRLMSLCQSKRGDSQYAVVVTADSVTMTSDHILTIKPRVISQAWDCKVISNLSNRPSLLLYSHWMSKVLVSKGQWVEEGAFLMIVRRLASADSTPANNRTIWPRDAIDKRG